MSAMLTGLAHVAVCVPDVDAAVAWYESVLGLRVLSPPYLMEGEAIASDMGELLPTSPVAVKAAIVGVEGTDHVIEVIEYPNEPPAATSAATRGVADPGLTHVGLVCDDMAATRAALEAAGVEMLTSGVADVARLRTTWFRDPWGVVFILVEKHDPTRPYWRQW
jgi:catechol 2,3-dioxygenase-like lactoylglutathione lyase family enzyme